MIIWNNWIRLVFTTGILGVFKKRGKYAVLIKQFSTSFTKLVPFKVFLIMAPYNLLERNIKPSPLIYKKLDLYKL